MESRCKTFGGCCRESSGKAKKKEDEAGYWGSANGLCDIPKHFFEKSMEYIKENHKFDIFVYLGDNNSHGYFEDDISVLINTNQYIHSIIRKTFSNTRVIPLLGNHEGDPIDNYDFWDKNNFVIKNIFPSFR